MSTMKQSKGFRIEITTMHGTAHAAFYAPGQYDGSWYTTNPEDAKVYKREANAQRVIDSYSWARDGYRPRIVSV